MFLIEMNNFFSVSVGLKLIVVKPYNYRKPKLVMTF